jgi:hypothetical protein
MRPSGTDRTKNPWVWGSSVALGGSAVLAIVVSRSRADNWWYVPAVVLFAAGCYARVMAFQVYRARQNAKTLNTEARPIRGASTAPNTDSAMIVVENAQAWVYGNPQVGAFVVYVDGKRRGIAMPLESFAFTVPPGLHSLRIRRQWYMSPKVSVSLGEHERKSLVANIPTGGIRDKLRLFYDPIHSLTLAEARD